MGLHYKRSLASRVTLLATVAVGISVAIVACAGYLTARRALFNSLDHSLSIRASGLTRIGVTDTIVGSVPAWALGAGDVKVAIMYSDGRPPATTDRTSTGDTILLGGPERAVAGGTDKYSARTITTANGTPYRVTAVPGAQDGTALVLAQSLEPIGDTLDTLGFVLFGFGCLGVLAAAAAGWGVARNGLRPVRRLTEAAEEIARTEKLEPIAVEGNDEIARLASAFNSMLVSLAASRDRQRQLVADAGHELRTPLTSLRTNLELLAQAEKQGGLSPTARSELFDDVRFQIEELTTLIGDLTELAREEPIAAAVEEVDLVEVADRAVDRVRRRAPGLHLDVALEPWFVTGEAAPLERAVTNLLDNAAKFSPPLGSVTVRLKDGSLAIADEGPGIPPADLPHVFERFYRSKESRTMSGSGLGLAIVRQVVERHSGTVRVASTGPDGTTFVMTLPGTPVSQPTHRVPIAKS
jgi:two-component system, OmpR family, sensor histidine kinase MprB